jgi:hypothetical protein
MLYVLLAKQNTDLRDEGGIREGVVGDGGYEGIELLDFKRSCTCTFAVFSPQLAFFVMFSQYIYHIFI